MVTDYVWEIVSGASGRNHIFPIFISLLLPAFCPTFWGYQSLLLPYFLLESWCKPWFSGTFALMVKNTARLLIFFLVRLYMSRVSRYVWSTSQYWHVADFYLSNECKMTRSQPHPMKSLLFLIFQNICYKMDNESKTFLQKPTCRIMKIMPFASTKHEKD